jgi:hypothetical protein
MPRKTATVRREFNPGPYSSIEEIREANAATGHHWFDADTMRGFGTRLGDGRVYGGRLFVSSDYTGFDRTSRAYTVRIALPDGSIDSLGEFLEFPTRASAHAAARAAAAGTWEVRHDPYDAGDDEDPERYAWRPYLTGPPSQVRPLGTRNTKRAAERLAALLNRERKARERKARS